MIRWVLVITAIVACASPSGSPARPTVRPVRHAYVTVHGIKTYYEERGAGPPLLLLHGGGASAKNFDRNAPAFAAHYRVIVPERMGHGRTADVPDRAFHYHEMAEDTVAFMHAIGVARADVVGWSDGGIIALDLAMNHKDLIGKVVTTGANFSPDGQLAEVVDWLKTAKPEEWPAEMLSDYKQLSPDGAAHWPIVFDRVRTMFLTEPNYTTAQLATISAPTLIMAGQNDVIRLEHTIELAHAIPNALLCIYPGVGHGWLFTKPDAFNAIVLDFLLSPPPAK